MVMLNEITMKNSAWGPKRWFQRRTAEVTDSDQTDDGIHTLRLFSETDPDTALRGEDYPALVRVWDNDVDAAIYDTD